MREIREFTFETRTFKVGDRIKIFHKGRWWAGFVDHFHPWIWKHLRGAYEMHVKMGGGDFYELISQDNYYDTYYDYFHAWMYLRLDEKVGADDELFDGYGLRATSRALDVIFENEPSYEPPQRDWFGNAIDPNAPVSNTIDDLPF